LARCVVEEREAFQIPTRHMHRALAARERKMEIKSKEDWMLLMKKAHGGDTKAMNEVAFWYRNGLKIDNNEIIIENENESFNWTKKAYDLGDLQATEEYADYLTDKENGICEPNIELGIKLYEKCFQNGSKRAAHCLGLENRNKQQFDKAFEYYTKSEPNEDFYQELTTALCYYYGVGVKADKLEALKILLRINNKEEYTTYEVGEANYLMGMIYLEGDVVEQDLDKARYYLELADQDGDHRSAQELLIIIGRKKLLN